MSIVVPPLLTIFATPSLLEYSGGSQTVAHIMDWREQAARPAVNTGSGWKKLRGAWSGGKKVSTGTDADDAEGESKATETEHWDYGVDDRRGWVIAFSWLFAAAIECVPPDWTDSSIVPLYYLVRRPTYILDFSLTLTFIHLILTTYYAKSFPTSFFWWIVQALGAVLMIGVAEQVCLQLAYSPNNSYASSARCRVSSISAGTPMTRLSSATDCRRIMLRHFTLRTK